MILFGVPALRRKAEGELRFFSRSRHRSERAVALRTYGTRITDQDRIDGALEAVHASIGVLGGRFGQLIPQCLRDLYELGHREQVLTFLVRRVRQYPSALVQGQVARTVVGIARLRVRGGGHDLLRFASTLPRDATGEGDVLSPDAVAELWWYACDQFRTRTEAWQVLGRWHADCVAHPELMPTFDELLDAMARIDRPERSADDRPLRTRIGLYREFWKKKAMEREQ
jgi:hypothetical protein